MNYAFWAIACGMAVVAIAFIVVPLRRRQTSTWSPILPFVLAIPLVAITIYQLVGSPNNLTAAEHADQSGEKTRAAVTDGSVGSIASLIDGLKSRLEQEPEDAGGWMLLAQSYRHLGRHDEAHAAYQKARALGKTDASFEPKAEAEPLKPSLRGRVSLAPELLGQLDPDDTVFIFAKESRAHRMPVVALRRAVKDLPFEFALTNADAMIAGTDIATYDSLVVTARVSRTGMATDSADNLEVWSEQVAPTANEYLELLIESAADQGNE